MQMIHILSSIEDIYATTHSLYTFLNSRGIFKFPVFADSPYIIAKHVTIWLILKYPSLYYVFCKQT